MKILYTGGLHTEVIHSTGKRLETDAPKERGGKGETFSPTDLFAASVATCMATVMAIAAEKLAVDLKGTTLEVEKEMVSAPVRRIGRLIIRFRSSLVPTAQIREKLEKAALECPVHRSIHPDIKVEVDFIWGLF